MNWMDCDIIRDLLPLYAEHICSKKSEEEVEKHLETCWECRKAYENMTAAVEVQTESSADEKKPFRSAMRLIVGITAVLAVMISCISANFLGAFDGGPASGVHFTVTVVYLAFWIVFAVMTRHYISFVKLSYGIGLYTLIASVYAMLCLSLRFGGFLSAILAIPVMVPFYGLRWFFDWLPTYAVAALLSLVWTAVLHLHLKQLKQTVNIGQGN